MTKQNKYIGKELDWLEDQWNSLKKYVDDNPIANMTDRVISLSTGRGEKEQIAATVEKQIESVQKVLAGLPPLLEAIQALREKNTEESIKVLGDQNLPGIMKNKFKG